MLRRATFPAVAAVSTPLFSATIAAAPQLSRQQRDLCIFSQQYPVLQNNSKYLKFKSPVWVEDTDEYWWGKKTALKKSQHPTELPVKRLFEYYNLDAVTNLPTEAFKSLPDTNGQHASFRTKSIFTGDTHKVFQASAEKHGFNSKYWITARAAKKDSLQIARGVKPTGVLYTMPGKFYNADQFANPKAIEQTPISAYKCVPYGGNFNEVLSEHVVENKFPTGLYLTMAQLDLFGLADDLIDDAVPAQVRMDNMKNVSSVFYNIEEVVDGDKLAAAVHRFPVETESFLISGSPVRSEATRAAMAKAGFGSKYWISEKDVVARGASLKEGAKGVSYSQDGANKRSEPVVLLFNAAQLKNPSAAFEKAGQTLLV